ncbi:MAG: STAS domain-containing protein [Bacteroidales bacterium]|nr:STAS domain-containing protein [Bacteroidales bacterium]
MNEIFRPEIFSCINKSYWKEQFSKDAMSGIIVGIVALPLAIAFAVASGVSPEKGLITAVIAGFLVSFLGGSRVQIGGPTGAFIVIVYGIVQQYGMEGLIISTMLAGVILVGFGLLKLGAVIKFIPHPVIVGFTSGIALTIFSTQIKDALGLQITNVPGDFIEKWSVYFSNIGTFNYWAVILTAATVLIMVYGRHIFKKIPGSFIAIILITIVVAIFKIPVNTIETMFGAIPTEINVSHPGIQWNNLPHYIQPAFTIALLGAIESLLSAVVADGMIGTQHRSNTELIAQGIANIITPIFGGIPATGAIARTATNVKNGGRTPVAGITHALTLLLIMLVFGNYAKLIPMPCLAGILIVVSYNMSEWRSFRSILKGSAYEIVVLIATFLLTVLIDLTVAIEIGMLLAAFLFIQRMAKLSTVYNITSPNATNIGSDILEDYSKLPKDIDIFEISGPFFFAAARQYQEVLQDIGKSSKIVIIRMRHVPFIDSTGINNFRGAIEFMQSKKKMVVLSGVRDNVLEDLRKGDLIKLIGREHIFSSFDEALIYTNRFLEKAAS